MSTEIEENESGWSDGREMSEEICDALDSALMREKMLITEIGRLTKWLCKTCEVIESEGLSVALNTDDPELGKWLEKRAREVK